MWRSLSAILTLVLLIAPGLVLAPTTVNAADAPVILSPTTINFGNQQVGTTSAPQFLQVINTTDRTFQWDGIAQPAGSSPTFQPYFGSGTTCQIGPQAPPLRPHEVCQLGMIFRPLQAGARSGEVTIQYNNGERVVATAPATLHGTGTVPPGVPSVGQDTDYLQFTYTEVGTVAAPQAVTLTNLGDTAMTVTSIAITGQNAGDFPVDMTCAGPLAPGASCAVKVAFKPSVTGFRYATLTITDSAPGSPRQISLSGNGTTPGACFGGVTGFCTDVRFYAYWQAHGDLAINGYPISDLFTETLEGGEPYLVQYFERVRLEYHPESTDPQYQVQLGQFGRKLHPADPPVTAIPGATYFAPTGHNVTRQAFIDYWNAHGGLAQFGYPISEEIQEQLEDGHVYTVQYFERARFEWHPESTDPQYQVLLGQFGRRIRGNR